MYASNEHCDINDRRCVKTERRWTKTARQAVLVRRLDAREHQHRRTGPPDHAQHTMINTHHSVADTADGGGHRAL